MESSTNGVPVTVNVTVPPPALVESTSRCARKGLDLDVRNAGTQPMLTVHNTASTVCYTGQITDSNGAVSDSSGKSDSAHPYLHSKLRESFNPAFFEFNDAASLSSYFVTTAIAKSHSAIWPRFVAGLLSGLFVVLGAMWALVAAGGVDPDVRAANPAIPKLLGGMTFPIALLLILFIGGDLFTGNCMTVGVGWFTGHITLRQAANILIVSFASNLCGCLFWAYFLGYRTELLSAEPYNSWLLGVAEGKLAPQWGQIVLRAVGANILVCCAILMGSASRDALGRFVIAWIPVFAFSTIGYEHVVADMAFIPLALFYGGSTVNVGQYIGSNIVPATIGNLIGGMCVVGGFLSYLYLWRDRPYVTIGTWLRYNLVPEQSVADILRETAHQFLHDLPIDSSGGKKDVRQ